MKKLILFTITAMISLAVTAQQLKIELILSTTPPATLTEWGNRREILTCIVSGQPGLAADFKIKAEIKTLDGTVIGTTDLVKAAIFNITGSTVILTANDVLPLDKMIFTGKYKSSLQRTGKLPSDNYTLCVQLVRPVDFTPFSEVKCKNFFLATTQLPILMKPYNEEILEIKPAQAVITFRWTPVVPRLTEPVTYRLQVFEVYDDQSPVMALRKNQPILDQTIIAATQYIWQPRMLFEINPAPEGAKPELVERYKKGKLFTWIIQSLDVHGNPVTQSDGNGQAFSEPLIFYVGSRNKQNNIKNK